MATWNDVNNLNRSFDGLRQTLVQNAMLRQQQAEQARRDELARRMQDIREQDYAGQIAARNAATASRERLGIMATNQRSVAAFLKNSQVAGQIAATREKIAAESAANAARIKAAEQAGNLKLAESIRKEVVGSFVGSMRQLQRNGATPEQAAMLGRSFSAMDRQIRSLLQQRAPAEFGLLQGTEEYASDPDDSANPLPPPAKGQSGKATVLQLLDAHGQAVANGDTARAAALAAQLQHLAGETVIAPGSGSPQSPVTTPVPSGGSDLNEGEFPEDQSNSQPAGATPGVSTPTPPPNAPAAGPPIQDPPPYYPDEVQGNPAPVDGSGTLAPLQTQSPAPVEVPAAALQTQTVSADPSAVIPTVSPTMQPTQNPSQAGSPAASQLPPEVAEAKAAIAAGKDPDAVAQRFKKLHGYNLPQ
jgi:hypothetical protein